MAVIYSIIPLGNGLTIQIYDHSSVYFGDFHKIRLEIICVPENEKSDDPKDCAKKCIYRQFIEKMGISSNDLERTKADILNNFKKNSLPYFQNEAFPDKLITFNSKKSRKKPCIVKAVSDNA